MGSFVYNIYKSRSEPSLGNYEDLTLNFRKPIIPYEKANNVNQLNVDIS